MRNLTIKLLAPWHLYNAGDVITREESLANVLINGNRAELYTQPKPAPVPEPVSPVIETAAIEPGETAEAPNANKKMRGRPKPPPPTRVHKDKKKAADKAACREKLTPPTTSSE